MGAWGPAIFSDDVAADVRDDFKTHLGDGLSSEAATQRLIEEYEDLLQDPEDGPVFWLALAATQWSVGRLLPDVQERALAIIGSGEDLNRWDEEDPTQRKKRVKVLETLRDQLLSPPPPAKKIPSRHRDANDWPVGAIVAYRLPSGRLALFRVRGHHSDKGGTSPVVELLDWHAPSLPSDRELKRLRIRKSRNRDYGDDMMIAALSRREYPADRLQLTGHILPPSQEPGGYPCILWRQLDAHLAETFGLD